VGREQAGDGGLGESRVFQGAHPYRIDEKGRLKMPAEFVAGLGSDFTVTRGQNGCLWIMPEADWRELVERVRGDSLVDQRALALQRYFIGSAVTLSLDAQGRLAVPPVLRELAGIRHEVMLVGIGSRIELWARERWDEYEARLNDELIAELARGAGI
jgi:MraZ protein